LNLLDPLRPHERLFTYKVAHDGGSAPNPYHGVCTLGICKPAIRRVARAGDVVVGFACAPQESRIIYCMVVDHVLPWEAYIKACNAPSGQQLDGISPDGLERKVPRGPDDPGDCIWPTAEQEAEVRPSWSMHGGAEDFRRDVRDGENVILSSRFWYFGGGDQHTLYLAEELEDIIPGRGHRSDANYSFRAPFVYFFNAQLKLRGISRYGKFGEPAHGPSFSDEVTRSRCRVQEKEFDALGEELPGTSGSSNRC
jgi:hypothetical protein